MNIKKYQKILEAIGMAGTEEVVPQENIADTGMDVNPEAAVEEVPQEEVVEEDPNAAMEQDMSGEIPTADGSNIENVMKSQKLLKLYNLYKDLLNYCSLFLESLEKIDINLIELETFQILKKYILTVRELTDKINNYMINIYSEEEYEKLLYVYVLFRTELTNCIKGTRDILKLNKIEEKENINEKKN